MTALWMFHTAGLSTKSYEKEYMQDVQDLNKVIKDNTRNDSVITPRPEAGAVTRLKMNLRSPSPSPQGLTNDDGVGVQSVDGVPYTSSNLRTDGQPEVGRGLPSIDGAGELGAFEKKAKEDMENITTINADQEKMQQRIEPIAVQMADDFNRCIDGSKEQFVNWCSGRSYEEIKTAIDVIDKSMVSPSGSVDFANAIDTVSKDVDGIGQKDIPNSNAIINDIDIEFGDFDMDFDER